MAKVSPIQNDFSFGEVGPLFKGRVDSPRYKSGVDTCKNYIPLVQGPLTRRPGTVFVAAAKNSGGAVTKRLVPFQYSTEQAYVLEFGDLYFRVYRNRAQVTGPYEVVTTIPDTYVEAMQFVQSADVLYLVHPSMAPKKVSRTAATPTFTISDITFLNGPWLSENTTSTTLTPSGTTGAITVTASSTTGINGNTGFQTTDIGRFIRMSIGSSYGWGIITAPYISTTQVNVTVQSAYTSATATSRWQLGLFYSGNYPSSVVFHEDRLVFAGVPSNPQQIVASNVGKYETFDPSDVPGTITSSNSWSFTLNASDVDAVRWISSQGKGLVAGTVSSEWVLSPSSTGEAITPTSVNAKRVSNFGSANTRAVSVGKALMFVQSAKLKLIEFDYFFSQDSFSAQDLNLIASHITESGIVAVAFQREPYPIVWCVRDDGVLIGLTYYKNPDELKAGWHKHVLGGIGVTEPGGTYREYPGAQVRTIAVIPKSDGSSEELWLGVERTINGSRKYYIEYMNDFFMNSTDAEDAFFVDSGLTLDNPINIVGITAANPPVVTTASAHGFTTGDTVRIQYVTTMTEYNDQNFVVTVLSGTTFSLDGQDASALSAGFLGEAREVFSSVSGLSHLEGQTVSILGDGAVLVPQVVTAGAVSLSTPSARVQAGLAYNSDVKTLRAEAGATDGTAAGKTRRTHRLGMQLERTLGLNIGSDFDNLDPVIFRTTGDDMSQAVPLFSGIKSQSLQSNYDFDNQVCLRQDQPTPGTIVALMPQMVTQDRG